MSLAYKTCPECGYPAPLDGVKCYRCKRRFQHPIVTHGRRISQGWGWVILEYVIIIVLVVGIVILDTLLG